MKSLVLILATIGAAAGVPLEDRVFGGQNATSGQFPFVVALQDPSQFCDGTIINTSWILTSGRCLYNLNENTTVLVGTHDLYEGGTAYNITKFIIHEGYNDTTFENDIGLIQIDTVLEFSDTVQALEFGEFTQNTTCTALGWGMADIYFPSTLQYVELTAVDFDTCIVAADFFVSWYHFGPEQMCTIASPGKGLCFTDWGGPLVCDGKLAGVISFSTIPCGASEGDEYPEVYTRPLAYADWIQTNTGA